MKQNKVHLGHKAKKRFGQNFLIDQNIIYNIVNTINPKDNDNLIEIGPGLAALTEPVCERTNHLTAIEVDKDLIERLKKHPKFGHKLSIIENDVLNVDFNTLATIDNKAKVFGNLPYNISTPLISHLLNYRHLISEMTFMLQKEVVNRICAGKGHKNYGRLSLYVQYFCQVLPVCEVPPESFKPAPKVDSAVVKLVPLKEIKKPVKDFKLFETITSLAFNQRRKTLKNAMTALLTIEDWQEIEEKFNGIKPTMRAEELSLSQYIDLTNYCYDKNLITRLQ